MIILKYFGLDLELMYEYVYVFVLFVCIWDLNIK